MENTNTNNNNETAERVITDVNLHKIEEQAIVAIAQILRNVIEASLCVGYGYGKEEGQRNTQS